MSAKKDDPALDSGGPTEGIKMVLTVTIVAAISAGLLGFVYSHVKDRITASRTEEKIQAFGYTLPDFDNEPLTTERPVALADAQPPQDALLYTATKGGEVVGYALQLFTTDGFGPRIDLIVAARPDGTVTGVYVLAHQETPGLGAKVTTAQTLWKRPDEVDGHPFLLQFGGKNPATFTFAVKKDGGDVDAITASTITSRAVTGAIGKAVKTILAVASAPPREAPALTVPPAADGAPDGPAAGEGGAR